MASSKSSIPSSMRPDREGMWNRTKRISRYWYVRLMRQQSSPKNLAFALALGVFIGALPIIPTQSIMVLGLAVLFRVNAFAAWLATCYSNVFTMVPFYYFLYLMGDMVTPYHVEFPQHLEMMQLLQAGWDVFLVMLLGGLLFGIPASILTYFGSLWAVRRYRTRKALRILRGRSS